MSVSGGSTVFVSRKQDVIMPEEEAIIVAQYIMLIHNEPTLSTAILILVQILVKHYSKSCCSDSV